MTEFTLTYARTVVLKRTICADNCEEALRKANQLEAEGNLGTEEVIPKAGSWVDEIVDEGNIWEVEES